MRSHSQCPAGGHCACSAVRCVSAVVPLTRPACRRRAPPPLARGSAASPAKIVTTEPRAPSSVGATSTRVVSRSAAIPPPRSAASPMRARSRRATLRAKMPAATKTSRNAGLESQAILSVSARSPAARRAAARISLLRERREPCCNDSERGCRQRYPDRSVAKAFCCPTGTRCCAGEKANSGTDCCGKDQICDYNTGFCRCSKTAKPCGEYACCEKGETCCPGRRCAARTRSGAVASAAVAADRLWPSRWLMKFAVKGEA